MYSQRPDSIDVAVLDGTISVDLKNKGQVPITPNPRYPVSLEVFSRAYTRAISDDCQRRDLPIPEILVLSDLEAFSGLMDSALSVSQAHNTCTDNGRTLCVHLQDGDHKEKVVALYGYKRSYPL